MSDFWTKLPRPFFALAPMEGVTDAAFRRLIARYAKPDVMFTEFTSADGLFFVEERRRRDTEVSRSERTNDSGQGKLRAKLVFSKSEHPIVAQLFTSSPERMEKAANLMKELGFDGVDINMGCPDKAIEKSGCGAALIKNPNLARELIRAAGKSGLPVSVKTRIGYTKDELDSWLPELLAEHPAAVTIHARTRKEMSDVPAKWDAVARAVRIRNQCQGDTLTLERTLIVGNGDVLDIADAKAKVESSSADGVMLGRAIFGNPFLFSYSRELENSKETKLKALAEHLKLFEELLAGTVNYATMKKHFKAYIGGWPGAKELRIRLMETKGVREAEEVINHSLGD